MSALTAAATGLAAGVHCATWGMFKDAPFEGFTWRTWVRSPIVATLIALVLIRVPSLDFGTGAAAVVVLWAVTYGFERALVEIYKTFFREQDQSKYTIPMQFAVFGKPVESRAVRRAAGMAYFGAGLLVLWGVYLLQTRGPDLPYLLAIFLVASPGGWISAFGGAWKDAPIEGFHTFKFFRSPAMTYGYGLALSLLTPSYPLIFMGSIGFTVATIETYKTFFFPNKKRGKFQGKTPTHPEHLRTRWRFAPLFAAIWIGVLGTAVAAFTALSLVLLVAPPALSAQAIDTVTVNLADAERRALARNPLLAGAEARIEVNRAQEARAKQARWLPELSLRNAYGIIPKQRGAYNEYGVLVSPDTLLGVNDMSWFTQLDVRLVQPLWTFGKLGSRIEAAGHAVEAAEAGREKTRADVLLMVRQLYWGVVLAQELEAAADDVMEKVEDADTTFQRQYDEGTATQNDMFKFQIFRYDVNRRYREVTAGLAQARAGLRAALGLDESVTVLVETEALDTVSFALQDLGAYLEMARANRPELQELQAGISARRALMTAEQRDAWPTLFFAGTITGNLAPDRYDPRNPFWQNQTNYFRGGGVLGFEWNFNFGQHRAEAAVQRTEMIQLESQEDALDALVEQEVRQAWLKANRAYTDVAEGRAALQASENWLRAELQTYDIGMSDIKDLIDAFRANAEMKVTQLRNIADFNTAVAELSRRVGLDLSATAR